MFILLTALITIGGVSLIMNVALTVVELAISRSIRKPEPRSFARIQLLSTHNQTIYLPALGALLAGLFVSLAASFIYGSLTKSAASSDLGVGIAILVIGIVLLVVTLEFALRKVGDPGDLVRHPYSIAAAARDAAARPRNAVFPPQELRTRLDEWEQHIAAHSLDVTSKKHSEKLLVLLDRMSGPLGFWRSLRPSLKVYWRACLAFPLRLGWLGVGTAMLVIGVSGALTAEFWTMANPLRSAGRWMPLILSIDLVLVTPMLTYAWARGSRGRRVHKLNREALHDARLAIRAAENALARMTREDERLHRVLKRSDEFFRGHSFGSRPRDRVLVQIGKLRLVLRSNAGDADEDSPGRSACRD